MSLSESVETSRLVVTEQLLGGVIPGGACGAAMNDDIFHGSGGCHHRAVLLSEESTFVRDLFLTDYHRESFLNQDRKSTRLNSSHIQKSRMPSSA